MNLIIDGNALLNVTANVAMYVIKKNNNFDDPYVTVDGKTFLKESSQLYFKKFTLNYILGLIIPLKVNLKGIYFVFDSVSWRKIYIEKYFKRKPEKESFGYKSHRIVDDHKKKMFLFINYFNEEVIPELTKLPGVHSIKVLGAEGDDIIAYLSDVIEGNKVIWTVDRDINQLADYTNDSFTFILGPKHKTTKRKRIYHPALEVNKKDYINFDVGTKGAIQFVDFMEKEREYDAIEIKPDLDLLYKIMSGDRSDDIPSVYTRVGTTGKRVNITELKAKKIIEPLLEKYKPGELFDYIDSQDPEFIDDIVNGVVSLALEKGKDLKIAYKEIWDNFVLNSKIIRLSQKMIPDRLISMMRTKFDVLDRSQVFDVEEYQYYIKNDI